MAWHLVITLRAAGGVRRVCECLHLSGLAGVAGAFYGSQQAVKVAGQGGLVAESPATRTAQAHLEEERAYEALSRPPRGRPPAFTARSDQALTAGAGRSGTDPHAGAPNHRPGVEPRTGHPASPFTICRAGRYVKPREIINLCNEQFRRL